MEKKVLLILCDGMRPDALEQIQHPYYVKMKEQGSFSLDAQTVSPSVTLPCHMSLFHSVDPQRHGVLTNVYTPQVRPIAGICEQLRKYDKTCAMFYNWEELKDLTRPDSMLHTCYISSHLLGYETAQTETADRALSFLKKFSPDFTFLYFGGPDGVGHKKGWMSPEYLEFISFTWDLIEKVCENIGNEYTVMVTADHGGHDRTHGFDIPEDMTIPVIVNEKGYNMNRVNLKDIAPTVCKILNVPPAKEWEGNSLI